MAIDSNAKKASLLNFGTPFYVIGPLLDGSLDTGEQLHLLHLYSGLAPEEPQTGGGGGGASPKKRKPGLTRAQREEREILEIGTIIAAWMN